MAAVAPEAVAPESRASLRIPPTIACNYGYPFDRVRALNLHGISVCT